MHGRLLFFIASCLFSTNEYVSCPEAITDGREELSCGKPAQSKDTVHQVKERTQSFDFWNEVQFLMENESAKYQIKHAYIPD